MIQITVSTPDNELFWNFYRDSIESVRSGLKSCVDQNLILNGYSLDNSNALVTINYYSINLEKANEFIQAYDEHRKIFADNGIYFSVSTQEIDFDTVQHNVFELITDTGCFGDNFLLPSNH